MLNVDVEAITDVDLLSESKFGTFARVSLLVAAIMSSLCTG